jgi:RNA polymerase sigma-70 factor (sigma-E family)
LSALYDEHYETMVKLAAMYVDDRHSAEEVVQDAFVRLLRGNYPVQPGREAAYLRQAVLNGARSALRKRRVRRLHVPDRPASVAAAEEGGMHRSERDRILEAVRRLPHKQASVVILRYYLDLSEADIADTLGMARGSVKSHAHRALKKLQKSLGDHYGEPSSVEGPPRSEPTSPPGGEA